MIYARSLWLSLFLMTLLPALALAQTPVPLRLSYDAAPGTVVGTAQLDCPATMLVGQSLQFNGFFSNTGTIPIDGVYFEITVNAPMTITPGSASRGTWNGTSQQQRLTIGTVNPDETITFDLELTAVASGTAALQTVFGDSSGPGTPDGCEIVINELADVFVVKAAAPASVRVGEGLAYGLLVGNLGPHTAHDVVVTDHLPLIGGQPAVQVITDGVTTEQGTCEQSAMQVICEIGTLAPGEEVEVLILTETLLEGMLTNNATVASDRPDDPDLSNNASEVTTEVTTGLTFEEVTDLIVDMIVEQCPEPIEAQAFLYPALLEEGDDVSTPFGTFSHTIGSTNTYFGWIDCAILSLFEHNGAFVFIEEDYSTSNPGALLVEPVQAWPLVNGEPYLDGAFERFTAPERIFGIPLDDLPVEDPGIIFDPIVPVPTNPRDCAVVVHGLPFGEEERRGFHRNVDLATDVLTSAMTGPQIDLDNVISLKDSDIDPIQEDDVLAAIQSLEGKCDRIYFWYNGHASTDGLWYLDSGLTYVELADALYATGADEYFVILDGCETGAAWNVFQTHPDFNQHHLYLFTSASADRSSHIVLSEDDENNMMMQPLYTRALSRCWSDIQADNNGDKQVSPEEAYLWMRAQNESYTIPGIDGLEAKTLTVTDPDPQRFEFLAVNLTITGQKFNDLDNDGVRDANEPGENDFEIELYDENGSLVGTTITMSEDLNGDGMIDPVKEQGRFRFENRPRGLYTLKEIIQQGWTQTFPGGAGVNAVNITTGSQLRILFGNHFTGIDPTTNGICGQKFNDRDGDGARDADEPGLGGFIIELLDEQGAVIAQTTTGAQDLDGDGMIDVITELGRFCFLELPDGTYSLREVQRAGWQQTFPAAPGTYTVTLPTGSLPPIRFGNHAEVPTYDWGDLPDPRIDIPACPSLTISCYPTLVANRGPSHFLSGELWLGATIDAEMDGQPTANADGDDATPDEDGLLSWSIDSEGRITFNVFATIVPPLEQGILEIWVDRNDDGVLVPADHVIDAPISGVGTFVTAPDIATSAFPGFVRMRLSTAGTDWPAGPYANGEVEDYLLVGADFGDAPGAIDPTRPAFPGGYPTSLAQDGARHAVLPSVRLGDHIDAQADATGQHDALEDDLERQVDDEDGFRFLNGFTMRSNADADEILEIVQGAIVKILPLPSTDGKLDGWIDWNRDGDWEDEGEQVFISEDIHSEMKEEEALSVDVPEDADLGYSYARFRFSRNGNLSFTGVAPGGEVEDYLLRIVDGAGSTPVKVAEGMPEDFALYPAYPNPFNPQTLIRYELSHSTQVRLTIFDAIGRKVTVLVDEQQVAGRYEAIFDAADLPSGVYMYRLEAGSFRQARTMLLVK